MPATDSIRSLRPLGEKWDLHFRDADLKDVLLFMARIAGFNIVIDPEVEGRITCDLVQVPWSKALDVFLRPRGYDWQVAGRTLILSARK